MVTMQILTTSSQTDIQGIPEIPKRIYILLSLLHSGGVKIHIVWCYGQQKYCFLWNILHKKISSEYCTTLFWQSSADSGNLVVCMKRYLYSWMGLMASGLLSPSRRVRLYRLHWSRHNAGDTGQVTLSKWHWWMTLGKWDSPRDIELSPFSCLYV